MRICDVIAVLSMGNAIFMCKAATGIDNFVGKVDRINPRLAPGIEREPIGIIIEVNSCGLIVKITRAFREFDAAVVVALGFLARREPSAIGAVHPFARA